MSKCPIGKGMVFWKKRSPSMKRQNGDITLPQKETFCSGRNTQVSDLNIAVVGPAHAIATVAAVQM